MSESLLVRLKAYDPRRGHVIRRFAHRGVKIHEDRGWYRVPRELGEYLRGIRQIADDPHSPLAFDVCSEDEAKETEVREAAERASRASPVDTAAVVTTSDDLPKGGARGPRR